jgi:hypothetical protein
VYISPGVRVSDSVTSRLSGGVVMLVKNELVTFVHRIHVEYDNCVALRLSKHLTGFFCDCVIIGMYLPPAGSVYYTETEIDNGIMLLENCVLDIYQEVGDSPLIIMGDFNSRTGERNAKNGLNLDIFSYDDDSEEEEEGEFSRTSKDSIINEFGYYLLSMCENFSLKIMNGSLKGDEQGEFTYIAYNGSSVIDYFILSDSIIKYASELRVISKVESKHMPVQMNLMVNNNKIKTVNTKAYTEPVYRYIWNNDHANVYFNTFDSLEVSDILKEATNLITVNIETALEKFNECIYYAGMCMRKKIKLGVVKNNPWFDQECKETKSSLRRALRSYTTCKTNQKIELDHLRMEYIDKRREYKKLLKSKRQDYKKDQISLLNENKRDSKKFWGTVKSIMNKATNENCISSEVWYKHFTTVFNSDTVIKEDGLYETDPTNIPIDQECTSVNAENCHELDVEITEDEVRNAIKVLKLKKASGPDGISGEFYKFAAPCVVLFLTKFFNAVFDSGKFPSSWSESIIHPLHKKGNIHSPDNYRGISLLNISSKLYTYILNRRLTLWIEQNGLLNESQAGFRKGYSTIDHLFTLYALAQKQLSNHCKLYAAFIDFKKAFDLVNRKQIWIALRKNGINGKMYNAIQGMYKVVKAKVKVGATEFTDTFYCPCGLKQGDNCSPILFSMLINELADDICQNGKHGITMTPDVIQILIMLFADDVVLLSNTIVGLQRQLNILNNVSGKLNLTVNREKSKIVIFRNGGYVAAREKWYIHNDHLDVVNVYKYLGVIFSTGLTFSHALEDMSLKAKRGVTGILRLLWKLGENNLNIFFQLFDCQIQPMLTYGSEVWGLTANHTPIERVHLLAIKRLINVSIKAPNTLVYYETGRFPLYIQTYSKSIKYWLLVIRMEENRIPLKAYKMLYELHCKNKRNWASCICNTLYKYGFGYVWENQGVENINMFMKVFKQRLIDCFHQEIESEIMSKQRFYMYSTFKQLKNPPMYLNAIKSYVLRRNVVQMRLGVSQLKPHKLRHIKPSGDLFCPFCKNTEETEIHFVLKCPEYNLLRQQYIPKKYYIRPNLFKLSMLFSDSRNCMPFAIFLSKAFLHRRKFGDKKS